ncbi:MAG: plasmid pRiA4b ORF-3 family protein, partial [Clostridiales bacterium]|nr:plasmid pRiA4b ORF-3 family protein [Clostridiales bacterium]
MAEKTKGKCKYCGREYAKAYMYRHLKACKKRAEELEKEKKTPSVGYFILEVTDKYENDHWLMVEITEEATLRVLDDFLRDIWLECCGHLSSFTINGISYEECPDDDFDWGPPSRSTNIKLKKVLREGITIKYDYDFGSTTSLVIKVK